MAKGKKMTKLKDDIDVQLDSSNENMKFVRIEEGLVAGAFEWKNQLFVRYQINDPAKLPAEEALTKVQEVFGFTAADVRNDKSIHLFDDGTDLRQAFLGEYEA